MGEYGWVGFGRDRVEVWLGLFGYVGWCGSVKGVGDRIGGGEIFNLLEDDGVFVVGVGED